MRSEIQRPAMGFSAWGDQVQPEDPGEGGGLSADHLFGHFMLSFLCHFVFFLLITI